MQNKVRKTRCCRIFLFCVTILFLLELLLRFVFGFCDAVLYRSSEAYEYIAQPNQHRYRFFAHIDYNSCSQRSAEPDSTKKIVLGLGDSVIFGGTMIDQDNIATTLFTKETGMQMLNISAGSWGPDNCAAYLREKGTFGATAMILVCSSHDAYDVMSHVPVVGVYPNYPVRQYRLALWEVADRYLLPCVRAWMGRVQLADPDAQVVLKMKNEEGRMKNEERRVKNEGVALKSSTFNPGFDQLLEISREKHIPLMIYLHPELGELQERQYNAAGQLIVEWAREHDVRLVKGIATGETPDMFRDVIHFNEKGQRHLADIMEKMIRTHL